MGGNQISYKGNATLLTKSLADPSRENGFVKLAIPPKNSIAYKVSINAK
ncbi:MAG: hypothetical protein AVDCRST_MAG74-986 [uncultured Pyrinomonadaceae bacterium]|uniref:Uncharacterized protein n=1 Tax=uncultured Pyrinomonadaceae bacterium TaxID=2283094 RepID=A0A6J4NQM0_9BACT|nr:MAG: hypothetical protein AVDCRST_MAG74-986 [uncultured Pyrinomonadaceae bacterium]